MPRIKVVETCTCVFVFDVAAICASHLNLIGPWWTVHSVPVARAYWVDTAIKTAVSNNCHWANFGNPIREKIPGEGAVATQREITYFDLCRSLRDPNQKIYIHYKSFFWFIQMSLQWGFEWYGNKRSSGLTGMPPTWSTLPWQSESISLCMIPKRLWMKWKQTIRLPGAVCDALIAQDRCSLGPSIFALCPLVRRRPAPSSFGANSKQNIPHIMLFVSCICWDPTPLHS